eukprot:TRINITY_DN18909_c0_g3_i1.p1 TRINITY_DN18909_c0_g3~~TRINITY_DN18909_c0_g3_i1.p1  ORF type:complete len:1196 (+),score=235.39 TRINITY_DN18909_c0_g3_i1:123-3710(+)
MKLGDRAMRPSMPAQPQPAAGAPAVLRRSSVAGSMPTASSASASSAVAAPAAAAPPGGPHAAGPAGNAPVAAGVNGQFCWASVAGRPLGLAPGREKAAQVGGVAAPVRNAVAQRGPSGSVPGGAAPVVAMPVAVAPTVAGAPRMNAPAGVGSSSSPGIYLASQARGGPGPGRLSEGAQVPAGDPAPAVAPQGVASSGGAAAGVGSSAVPPPWLRPLALAWQRPGASSSSSALGRPPPPAAQQQPQPHNPQATMVASRTSILQGTASPTTPASGAAVAPTVGGASTLGEPLRRDPTMGAPMVSSMADPSSPMSQGIEIEGLDSASAAALRRAYTVEELAEARKQAELISQVIRDTVEDVAQQFAPRRSAGVMQQHVQQGGSQGGSIAASSVRGSLAGSAVLEGVEASRSAGVVLASAVPAGQASSTALAAGVSAVAPRLRQLQASHSTSATTPGGHSQESPSPSGRSRVETASIAAEKASLDPSSSPSNAASSVTAPFAHPSQSHIRALSSGILLPAGASTQGASSSRSRSSTPDSRGDPTSNSPKNHNRQQRGSQVQGQSSQASRGRAGSLRAFLGGSPKPAQRRSWTPGKYRNSKAAAGSKEASGAPPPPSQPGRAAAAQQQQQQQQPSPAPMAVFRAQQRTSFGNSNSNSSPSMKQRSVSAPRFGQATPASPPQGPATQPYVFSSSPRRMTSTQSSNLQSLQQRLSTAMMAVEHGMAPGAADKWKVVQLFHEALPRSNFKVQRIDRVTDLARYGDYLARVSESTGGANLEECDICFYAPANEAQLTRLTEMGFVSDDFTEMPGLGYGVPLAHRSGIAHHRRQERQMMQASSSRASASSSSNGQAMMSNGGGGGGASPDSDRGESSIRCLCVLLCSPEATGMASPDERCILDPQHLLVTHVVWYQELAEERGIRERLATAASIIGSELEVDNSPAGSSSPGSVTAVVGFPGPRDQLVPTTSHSPAVARRKQLARQQREYARVRDPLIRVALQGLERVAGGTMSTVLLPSSSVEAESVVSLYLLGGGGSRVHRPPGVDPREALGGVIVQRIENQPLFAEYAAIGLGDGSSAADGLGVDGGSPRALVSGGQRYREDVVWHGTRLKRMDGEGASLATKLQSIAEKGFDPQRCTKGAAAEGGIWVATTPLASFGHGCDGLVAFILCLAKTHFNEWVDATCARVLQRERVLPLYSLVHA